MRRKWKLLPLLLVLAMLSGCFQGKPTSDIVILYTNDIYCAIDEDIGYAGLAAYKAEMLRETPYVTLVDCGDAIQGDAIGTVSRGEYPVSIMNAVGYDFAVLGNHEFDYGMDRLSELIEQADAQYLGCNIRYSGDEANALEAVKPYEIVSYGTTKVAFVGVCTPESIAKSSPASFKDDNGNFVYDFYSGEAGAELCAQVQETVDACRGKGADYVVVLSHLGVDEESAPFRSIDLIAGTSGIDAVLDGHSRSVILCQTLENKEGEDVLLSSTGTRLNNIGQLAIAPNGNLSTTLISDYTKKDDEMQAYIESIQSSYETDLARVVAKSEVLLTTQTEQGVRLVRSRETNLGDFCADAYRAVSGADIAFVNGGGIRADLPKGEITYGDILKSQPYGNTLCVVEATGQQLLDALEMASRATQAKTDNGKDAVGESGSFLQVSGLRYTIDTTIASSVKLDENGMFLSAEGVRRVKDVEVQNAAGEYSPIDPAKTYTLASHNYLIKEGGDGLNLFVDSPLLLNEGMPDYQVLITYITNQLGGSVGGDYANPQGRITVK